MYSNFAGDNVVRISAHFICHCFMCEIVTANVCLFHLNVLSSTSANEMIVKLEKEKAVGDSQEPFILDILQNE